MFDKFFTDMKIFIGLKENNNEYGSINWNFI